MTTMLSPKEIANDFGTDARTLRKFLRSDASGIDSVGKGHRYAIPARSIKGLRKKFDAWVAANAPADDATDDATDA